MTTVNAMDCVAEGMITNRLVDGNEGRLLGRGA